jgi:hypothetical protein
MGAGIVRPLFDDLSTLGSSEAVPQLDRDAFDRMRIPRHLADGISGLDEAQMVPAREAGHMRPDDYVLGLVLQDEPRAYPLWVIDNYHVVNDVVGSMRFVVASCERCQSGVAFRAEPPGSEDRAPIFHSTGFQNGSLVMKDLRSGSSWIHWEGFGLNRRAQGMRLPWIPTLHIEWADWVELHPDTVVMVPPEDPQHPDARHGHGREEWFARPGMDTAFLSSIVGPPDVTYPENEMVLAIEGDTGWMAYPLKEVHRDDGVVHDESGGRPIVVFAGPRPDGFTMAAFEPRRRGRSLSFVRSEGGFRDLETQSSWTIEGVAIRGPLTGERLPPVRSFYVRWHAVAYWHRNTSVYRSGRAVGMPRDVDALGFEPLLARLETAGDVRVEGPIVSQRRPRRSVASLTIRVDGHRLHLHRFTSPAAAADYESFEAAISGFPIRARSYEARTVRVGSLVVESDPDQRYLDPFQVAPIPFRAMEWAPILDEPALRASLEADPVSAEQNTDPGFNDLIRSIERAGFEVLEIGYLPPSQLRPGCVDGIALTIEADRFLMYLFPSAESAEAYAAREGHSLSSGPFVLRSTPEGMYEHQGYEIGRLADGWIRWSRLLSDRRFNRALEAAADRLGTIPADDTEPSRHAQDGATTRGGSTDADDRRG